MRVFQLGAILKFKYEYIEDIGWKAPGRSDEEVRYLIFQKLRRMPNFHYSKAFNTDFDMMTKELEMQNYWMNMLKDQEDDSDVMEQVRIGAIKDKERAAHYDIPSVTKS